MNTTQFDFQANTIEGKRVRGIVSAISREEALEKIRKQNLTVIFLKEQVNFLDSASTFFKENLFKKPPNLKQMAYFYKKTGTLLSSGVVLSQAFQLIRRSGKFGPFSKALEAMENSLIAGSSLMNAMKEHPHLFDSSVVNTIGAAEESGMLPQAFMSVSEAVERRRQMIKKVKSAMTYPLILIGTSIGVILFLLAFVIPMFQDVYQKSGNKLPAMTQIVITISDFILAYWWAGGLAVAIAWISYVLTANNQGGREFLDRTQLKIPYVKNIVLLRESTRFCDTLSSLVGSGIDLKRGLDLCREIASNSVMRDSISDIATSIEKGLDFPEAIQRTEMFPPIVLEMVTLASTTGQIDSALTEARIYLEEELNEFTDTMTSLIEPVLLIVVSSIIVFLLIAMYLPIFKLADVIT